MTTGKTIIASKSSIAATLLVILLCLSSNSNGQICTPNAIDNDSCYDRTSVCVKVYGLGDKELPVLIRNNDIYLPVVLFFNLLKIRNTPALDLGVVTGFIITRDNSFIIDAIHQFLRYKDKSLIIAKGDIIKMDDDIFLKSQYFGEAFGFECKFEFDNLSVRIQTPSDMPAIRERKLEAIRANLKQLKGESISDTTIKYKNPLFHFGMADWAILSNQQFEGPNDTRANLALGANIAGTEANIGLNYYSNQPFNSRQQYLLWRYANNNNKTLRQITAGRINHNAISSIYSPVAGIQFTNAPTRLRKSFGNYRVTDITQPGWIVEVYVNNILVDYTKADASGFFSFDIPLVYGSTAVRLRFYGPWGEEYSQLKNINIPFSFLPKNEFEYTVSAALVEERKTAYFSKAGFNYGISQHITASGGAEYLSSVSSGAWMPYAGVSLRLSPNLLASGEYSHGVRTKAMFNYRLGANAMFEGFYIKYARGQTAIIFNYLEERKAIITIPFRTKHLSGLSRILFNQALLPNTRNYTNAEWLLSAGIGRLSVNLNNLFVSSPRSENGKYIQYIYSDLSVASRLSNRLIFISQAQYAYKTKELIATKCKFEYFVNKNTYLNASLEKSFSSNMTSASAGFRYDFAYARTGGIARQFNDQLSVTGFARGSFIVDNKTNYFAPHVKGCIRTGAITLLPYLDLNGNGIRNNGEPKVQGLRADIRGGRVQYDDRDTLVRILDLEPYTNYYIDLSRNNFRNITWDAAYPSIEVKSIPNQMQLIEIPILVRSEVSGTVYAQNPNRQKDRFGLKVCFYKHNGDLAGCTTVGQDGRFMYNNLPPGEYYAVADTVQLGILKLKTVPSTVPFIIRIDEDGDIIEQVDFMLIE